MKSELFQVIPNNGKRGAYYKSLQSIVVSNYHNLQNQFSRRSEWFVKLWLESQLRSYRCYLVTLTYRPVMCPVIDVSTMTYYSVMSLIRNHLPFHCSSKGFGKGWEDKFNVDSVLENGFLIPTYNKKLNAYEDRYYKLPRSLFDTYFYEHHYFNFEKVRHYMKSSQFIHYFLEILTFA